MRALLATALLGCMLCTAALAEEKEKVPPSPSAKLCRENRDRCEEMQDRRAEFCKDHVLKCETRRERTQRQKEQERRRLFCKQHPEQCPNRHDDEEQFHPHTAVPGEHDPGPPR